MYKLFGESHSQSGQESFVLSVLKEKKNGFYLEIGGFDGVDLSNTFLLETKYAWTGIAVEIDGKRTRSYNKVRANRCVRANAVTLDYKQLFLKYDFPKQIDYLQVDIEPASNSWKALQAIPLDEYRFTVITFEHDLYAHERNAQIKIDCHELLTSLGYVRVVSNVMNEGNAFEDWYVDSTAVPASELKESELCDVDFKEIFA